MTSSSPRKRRTTVSSDARRLAAICALALLVAAGSCRDRPRETLITYFNPEIGLSLRYPASWKTLTARQENVWYRNFLAPPVGPSRKPAISVTLLAGPAGEGFDSYARVYISDNTVLSTEDDVRRGLEGKHFRFNSPKADMRYSLLLFREKGVDRLIGLYTQGETESFEKNARVIEEIERSLTLERPADYVLHRNAKLSFALGIPASWKYTRQIKSGGTHVEQWISPALAADSNHQTIHASITVRVEPLGGGSLDLFYRKTRAMLGEQQRVVKHEQWRDGYLDLMRVETPMATSYVKGYYRIADGRGYSLIFEAREDVYHAMAAWSDLIATTFKIGSETK
jgi:hypothetical protein